MNGPIYYFHLFSDFDLHEQEMMDDSDGDADYNPEDESSSEEDCAIVPDSTSDTSEIIELYPALATNFLDEKSQAENKEKLKGVTVNVSNNLDVRKWDKIHFCLFCDAASTNITKHYLGPHKEETEIQKILNLSLKSNERKLELLRIRNAGDFKHNTEILKKGKGVLVTWTRKQDESSADNYLPCECCLALFLKTSLWRHRQVCPLMKNRHKSRNVQSEASLLPVSTEINQGLKVNVLGRMSRDAVAMAARGGPYHSQDRREIVPETH